MTHERHPRAGRPGRRLLGRSARLLTVLGPLIGCVLALTGGPLPAFAQAQPPPGSVLFDQPNTDVGTVLTGATDAPCTEPGTPELPVDSYNAVVTGPGSFAPNPVRGQPDGVAVVVTDNVGLSSTEPIRFTFRASLVAIAAEQGSALLPGEYVLTFRCVNGFFGTVYQTFTAEFTLTGDPVATAFTATDPAVPSQPGSGPPSADVAPPPPANGPDPAAVTLVAVIVGLTAVGTLGYVLRRRSRTRS